MGNYHIKEKGAKERPLEHLGPKVLSRGEGSFSPEARIMGVGFNIYLRLEGVSINRPNIDPIYSNLYCTKPCKKNTELLDSHMSCPYPAAVAVDLP